MKFNDLNKLLKEGKKVNSAGLVLYHVPDVGNPKVFLVHPGGPYSKKTGNHIWGIPKGKVEDGESNLEGAKREFTEETGINVSNKNITFAGSIRQNKKKSVYYWGLKGNGKEKFQGSNMFNQEWPPKSGKMKEFPEVDQGEWFNIEDAKNAIFKSQIPILNDLENYLKMININK
jgi:predicted NUDIX family NTP pyrophosphohydrolase